MIEQKRKRESYYLIKVTFKNKLESTQIKSM